MGALREINFLGEKKGHRASYLDEGIVTRQNGHAKNGVGVSFVLEILLLGLGFDLCVG
jgi:hypothetical protein